MMHRCIERRSCWALFAGLWIGPATARAVESAGKPMAVPGLPEVGEAAYLLQLLLSLLLVIGLILAAAWLLRRLSRLQGSSAGHLRIIGGLSLGSRERVILIEAGGTHLLLGVAPGRVQTLHVYPEPPAPVGAGSSESPPFAGRLQAILQGKRSS